MDAVEIRELVELYGKAVYGFCYRLTGSQADTDDLYQETFLKAMELCHKIDKNHNPKGFLIAIAAGLWKNNRRKYARRQRIAPMEALQGEASHNDHFKNQPGPEDIAVSNEDKALIQNAAHQLDQKLRIPLYMYYTAEMSSEEIASALKIPVGTVKSRLHRARKALKKKLEMEAGKYERF
ncbi:RNA polymerase sigma factor [Alkaliphilus crotonatoxidans]